MSADPLVASGTACRHCATPLQSWRRPDFRVGVDQHYMRKAVVKKTRPSCTWHVGPLHWTRVTRATKAKVMKMARVIRVIRAIRAPKVTRVTRATRVTRVTRMTRVNTVARVTTDQGNQDEVSIIIFCLSHHDFGLKRVTSV